jgi:hypothetical protein
MAVLNVFLRKKDFVLKELGHGFACFRYFFNFNSFIQMDQEAIVCLLF